LGKGEERQQKTTLASLSWLYLVTWRFLLSQWPLRIKNDVEIPRNGVLGCVNLRSSLLGRITA
jgi:hypothetical protein